MAGRDLHQRVAGYGHRLVAGPGQTSAEWLHGVLRRAGRTPVGRVGHDAARSVVRRWRGSLQLRIVSITLVSSTVLVGAFGFVVAERITDGLVDAKVQAALSQVESAGSKARQQLSILKGVHDPALRTIASALVSDLADEAGPAGEFEVVLDGADLVVRLSPISRPSSDAVGYVPTELGRTVGSSVTAHQFTRAAPDGGGRKPYLVVGTPVQMGWGTLKLYYLFPLDDEVKAAQLVHTTVSVTGVALVLLLSLIAWMVTRMVVSPVQVAARTAQRLSAGLLHERMSVRGADELAKLASSFNQMAANLQYQIVQLEELSRLQRRFTSDVSHELRTPLTTVRMAAEILHSARQQFSVDVARSAELLHDELDRFESLLSDLLEISRFDAGFAQLEAEPVDLVPLVRRVTESLSPLAHAQEVPIALELPDEPVIADVDPRRVERILRNLIGNAVEHGDGKPVTVTMAAHDSAVGITVRDRGVGLRPGEEKLVFNRFWRADPSRARQTGGTGLGLSISLEDSRLHGGWLEAWGAVGKGSQFRLTLPCRAGERLISSPLPLAPGDFVAGATVVGGGR